jgi:hypothetical protein
MKVERRGGEWGRKREREREGERARAPALCAPVPAARQGKCPRSRAEAAAATTTTHTAAATAAAPATCTPTGQSPCQQAGKSRRSSCGKDANPGPRRAGRYSSRARCRRTTPADGPGDGACQFVVDVSSWMIARKASLRFDSVRLDWIGVDSIRFDVCLSLSVSLPAGERGQRHRRARVRQPRGRARRCSCPLLHHGTHRVRVQRGGEGEGCVCVCVREGHGQQASLV